MEPSATSDQTVPQNPPEDLSQHAQLPCWTPSRLDIKAWLRRNASSLAELYDGAVRLLYTDPLPGRVRFVAHAVREIRNRLPDIITGATAHERLEYTKRFDEIAQLPGTAALLTDLGAQTTPKTTTVTVDRDFARAVANILRDHLATRKKSIDTARRLFEGLAPENTTLSDNLVPVLQQWQAVTNWFEAKNHDTGYNDAYYDEADLRYQFTLFEKTLAALTRPFFDTIGELDEILEKPTPDQVPQAVALLARPEQRRYFFDRLNNPEWLTPLDQKGFFRDPPSPQRDDEKGTIRFPPWPATQYLARMASIPEAQAAVSAIALAIPPTENIAVHRDLTTIATRLPASAAVNFVPKAKKWVATSYGLLGEEVGSLVSHLACGGERESAIKLARAMLYLKRVWEHATDVKAHFEPWHYARILDQVIPSIAATGHEDALDLVCDLLELAAQRRKDGRPITEDLSAIWHPHIHGDDDLSGIRNILVARVRNVAVTMARQGPNETIKAVEFLEGRPTKVFHRIAFDIIRRQRQVVPDLVAAHLTNHAFFDDASLRHEYDHLACEAFGQLSPPQQNAILTWIEQGPPPSTHERWEQHAGQQHPAENWELYTKYWQLDRLTPIADSLPSSWHERYRQLIAEIGPVPPVPQEGYLDTSPVTQEDLARMTPQAILDYLRGWEPGEREHVLSREGLGRALAGVVAENPTQFDTLTIQLRTLHPTYVQWYFRGLREAIQKGRTCTWQVALDLAGWAAAEHDARKTEDLVTRDGATWRDTGSVIADVLTFAVTKTPDIIPYRHREQVWQVLSTFVEDPEPTPQYELEYGPPNMEPYTLALNSTRGKAMEAVIQYALWVRRARNDEYRGFDDLSEVRAVLDQHLDPVHDSSLAIRSVYGRFFPWIVLLDQDWAAERAKTIFDGELGQAAWEAYLTYCPVYDDTAKLLTGQYDQAITTLAKAPPKSRPQNDTANHLGQHLIARYWRGQLALDQGLFARFFAEAPEDLRAAAIRFAGRALSNTEGTVDAEVLRRLTTFWVSRRQIANSALDRHRRELAGFGFWFASGKLDDEWALQQLRDILALVHTIDDDFLVLQQLAKLAAVFPLATVECLAAFAPGDQNYWRIMASEKEVRSVLRTALAGEDHVAQRAARDLVNRLGALGYSGYRTILQ